MKKVLSIFLAVAMVFALSAVTAFAATTTNVTVTLGGSSSITNKIHQADSLVTPQLSSGLKNGDEFTLEIKPTTSGDSIDFSLSFKIDIDEVGDPDGSISLKSQDGKEFTFVATCDATEVFDASNYFTITVSEVSSNGATITNAVTYVAVGYDSSDIISEETFQNLKDSNEDATVKASIDVGPYITVTDVTTPRDVNKTVYDDAPSAIESALEGKNYAYAGYKFVQALPGVGTMSIKLSAELLLTGADRLYVYRVSDDTFTLYASSDDDKKWEVTDDGTVEFPVSATGQYIITDQLLSSTDSSSSSSSGSDSSSTDNPSTGANDMVGAAVVMALVAGAGIVAFRK